MKKVSKSSNGVMINVSVFKNTLTWSLFISSLLSFLKLQGITNISWWWIFSPVIANFMTAFILLLCVLIYVIYFTKGGDK